MVCERTEFDSEQKSSKFMRAIITLVLSANNNVADTWIYSHGMVIYIYYEQ